LLLPRRAGELHPPNAKPPSTLEWSIMEHSVIRMAAHILEKGAAEAWWTVLWDLLISI
jgi:hypothetical protein